MRGTNGRWRSTQLAETADTAPRMDFISITWIGWIVVTTSLYWAAPVRARIGVIVAATAFFLILLEPMSLVWLGAMTAVTYLVTRGARPDGKRAAMAIAPIAAVLLAYKLLSVTSGDDLVSDTVVPLGLSYYALRCIHYALERYKGSIRDLGVKDVIGYLFFLPTIFVGPIHRFPEWKRDSASAFDPVMFAGGVERIVHGFVKVAFLGNFLVSDVMADWSASVTTEGSAQETYLEMVRIGLNLYFQFSGYSDLAIGFAMLLGYRVMENFRWPFLQRNINEFWNTWHISLTSWSRDYVYNSTIARFRSPALGVLASLIAIALWHELSLRYLLWGAYHGIGIIVWQRSRSLWKRLPSIDNRFVSSAVHAASVLTTVHFVFLGFLLVRQDGVGEMIDTLNVLATGWGN